LMLLKHVFSMTDVKFIMLSVGRNFSINPLNVS
jgi:hypothetical protein